MRVRQASILSNQMRFLGAIEVVNNRKAQFPYCAAPVTVNVTRVAMQHVTPYPYKNCAGD